MKLDYDKYEELRGRLEENVHLWSSGPLEDVVTETLNGILVELGYTIPEKPKSRKELQQKVVETVGATDLCLILCEAEGVSREEAIDRIMKTDPDTVDQLLIQYHYVIEGENAS